MISNILLSLSAALFISSAMGQSADCITVLSIWRAMGGSSIYINGCDIPGVRNNNGVVTMIGWQAVGLRGNIPRDIGKLKSLYGLGLHGNQLTGPIPAELWTLTNLESLFLMDNQLTGTIPPELGNLKKLNQLRISNNQFTGSIPAQIGNLDKLEWLLLDRNRFSGPIPSQIGNLRRLQYMQIQYNSFSGHIPTEIGKLKNLKDLYVFNNQLTGFPSTLTTRRNTFKILFPNPMSSIPYDVFAESSPSGFSAQNWTNLMRAIVPRKRQLTSSLKVNELYAMCNLNDIRNREVPAGCVSGIYNRFCINFADLASCHNAYNIAVSASYFSPLLQCAAWKSGPRSSVCANIIQTFNVNLGYMTLTSTHARDFALTIFGSSTYAPCRSTPTISCKW